MANGSEMVCDKVVEAELYFAAVWASNSGFVSSARLYVLPGLSSDVLLGMDWLKRYNSKVNWVS